MSIFQQFWHWAGERLEVRAVAAITLNNTARAASCQFTPCHERHSLSAASSATVHGLGDFSSEWESNCDNQGGFTLMGNEISPQFECTLRLD